LDGALISLQEAVGNSRWNDRLKLTNLSCGKVGSW
jgi:hypothetical protein